jgi:hypothetical protein
MDAAHVIKNGSLFHAKFGSHFLDLNVQSGLKVLERFLRFIGRLVVDENAETIKRDTALPVVGSVKSTAMLQGGLVGLNGILQVSLSVVELSDVVQDGNNDGMFHLAKGTESSIVVPGGTLEVLHATMGLSRIEEENSSHYLGMVVKLKRFSVRECVHAFIKVISLINIAGGRGFRRTRTETRL